MKKFSALIFTVAVFLSLTGLAGASLIDDDVIVKYQDPFSEESTTVTVQAGDQDAVDLLFGVFTVDLEADSVLVDFNRSNNWASVTFAGLVLDDLNDSNPDNILLDIDVTTNMAGWSDDRIWFDEDTVTFNWEALFVDADTSFMADLVFGPNPIPIPNSLLLFATGIVGFALIRRKIKE